MKIKEFVDKWGIEGTEMMLGFKNRTSVSIEAQYGLDRLVEDLISMLEFEANKL